MIVKSIFYISILFVFYGCAHETAVFLSSEIEDEFQEELITFDAPIYPKEFLETGIEGYVKVIFSITKSGKAVNASIFETNLGPKFQEAAIFSVKSSIYKPKFVDGVAVQVDNKIRRAIFWLEGKSAPEQKPDKSKCESTIPERLLKNRRCKLIDQR